MVYVILQFSVYDGIAYKKYLAKFLELLGRFKGALLINDGAPQVLEGSWEHERTSIFSFATEALFDAWFGSMEYRRLARERKTTGEGSILVLRDLAVAGLP